MRHNNQGNWDSDRGRSEARTDFPPSSVSLLASIMVWRFIFGQVLELVELRSTKLRHSEMSKDGSNVVS